MSSTTDFLKDEVYPSLHAVDAGLLDHLNPKPSSRTYIVNCPQCGMHEGFYFPYSGYINCPRKNECGVATSIWDVISDQGVSNKDVFTILCESAGVTPPDREGNFSRTASDLVTHITRRAAISETGAARVSEFCKLRGLSMEDFKFLGYGYYPGNSYIISALNNSGADLDECEKLGFISRDRKRTFLDDRIVGYWKQKDGTTRLWGRYIGTPPKGVPKYWFASSEASPMQKVMPYRFEKSNRHKPYLCVEGTLDADSLRLVGYNGLALGQASLNEDQALFLCMAGAEKIVLITDSGKAGTDGVFTSIRHTLPLGLQVSVSLLGEGMDDIDAIRQSGGADAIKKAVSSAIPATDFLANIYAASFYDQGLARYRSNIDEIVKQCDSVMRSRYKKRLIELGIDYNPESDASLLYSMLLRSGASHEEANVILERKHGVQISFTEVDQ